MRITRFEAENFKRLKVVEIDPDSNTVVLGGRNAQGKSSVLDGIMAALAGKAGAKELVRPIRDGEKMARVLVVTDDLRVERKWTPSGSTVTVGPKDGAAKLNSPQAVLDKLIGTLSFDPLEFAEADDKAQVKTLISLIGQEEFDRIATERQAAYDERTQHNRDVKRLDAQIDALPEGDGQPVGEKVNVARLSTELEAAIELEAARLQYEQIEIEIANLRERQARISKAAKDVVAKINPRNSEVVRVELSTAEARNQRVDDYQRLMELLNESASAKGKASACTTIIEQLDEEKTNLIENATLPVEGLGFDEDGVTYNGVPFRQSSSAERLKVSVAMAMAMNPELKVICIRDASLLDGDSRAALVAMAKEHDYQIWYEVVGDPGEIGVIIEDGEVQ